MYLFVLIRKEQPPFLKRGLIGLYIFTLQGVSHPLSFFFIAEWGFSLVCNKAYSPDRRLIYLGEPARAEVFLSLEDLWNSFLFLLGHRCRGKCSLIECVFV